MADRPSPSDFSIDENAARRRPSPSDFVSSAASGTTSKVSSGNAPKIAGGFRAGGDEDTSALSNIAGGLARGIRKDPIAGALFDNLVEAFPGVDEEDIDRLVTRTQNSTLSDVFSLVGEYGPSFALGTGAFSLGRNLAIKGVAKIGAGQGLKTAAGRVAGRQLTSAQQIEKFGAKRAKSLVQQPMLERAAQIGGGAVGLGSYMGAEELVDGAPLGDAARTALFGAALAGTFEGALFGLTSLPIVGLKGAKDPTKINAYFEQKVMPLLGKEIEKLRTKGDRITHQINEILGVNGQTRELARALEGLPPEPLKKILTVEQKTLLGKKQQALKVVKGRIQAVKDFRKEPLGSYLNGEPYDPKGFQLTLAKFRLNTFQTPESLRGQLGRTMNRFIELVDEAETGTKLAGDLNKVLMGEMARGLGKALGFSAGKSKDGRNFGRAFNAWEKFGDVGVRNFMVNEGRGAYADDAIKLFEKYDEAMLGGYNQLVKLGAEIKLTPGDLQKLGVTKYIPHILDDIPEQAAVDRMAAVMGEMKAQQLFNLQQRNGLSKFGSIDFQRKLKGSLLEKVLPKSEGGIYGHKGTDGLPFNTNPIDSGFQYLNAVHRRLQYGQRFGLSGEIKDTILKAAREEGASAGLSHSIIDLALGHRYYDQAMQQFSRAVTGLETGSKLGLAVLPNMSQSINTVVFGGLRNFTRGLILASKGEGRSEILQSVAMMESVVEGLGRTFGKTGLKGAKLEGTGFTRGANILDAFAHGTLKYTGFTQVEKWNRVLAASTGYHVVRDTLAKSAAGKLRGQTLDVARRRMQTLGVDLDKTTQLLMREGPDSPAFKEIIQRAMFKSSTTTQFNPNILRKPILWNHPYGKVMAQFKTFALGQGRFIRDQVFLEAKHGNLRPLAYFASVYPIAGEVVAETKAFARLKDRKVSGITGDDDFDRIIQDYSMVGGLGLLSDMFTSARFGKPLEGVLGPGVSDASSLVANLAQGRPDKMLDMVLRTPTAQAIKFGAVAGTEMGAFGADRLSAYLESIKEDGTSEDRSIIDLGQLQAQNRKRNKQP